MDLQAANTMDDQRSTSAATMATLLCFALACAVMIGSLLAPQGRPAEQASPSLSAISTLASSHS